ncbi:MAG: DnaJ C-terminal domain-containing protein [Litorilinea sp.]
MDYKDYYETLGVAKNADDKEIKRAFRKLAQQYHPDKNPGNAEAERRFKEINEAYTVLSDGEKRKKYDRFGSQWEQYSRTGGRPEDFDWGGWATPGGRPGRGGQTRTVTPEEFEQMFGGAGGFSTFFDTLFGGNMGGASMGGGRATGPQYRTRQMHTDPRSDPRYGFGSEARSAQKAATLEAPVEVTLEEAFAGTMRMLQSEDGKRLEVNIPKGVDTGSRVRMRGGAGGEDIFLKITVKPHATLSREGNNLRVKVPVDFYTAVLGGEVEVPTLERAVVLTIPAGTQNGKTFRLRNLGMPLLRSPDTRGDLLAEVEIQMPTEISEEERKLFEELRALRQKATS